MVKDRVNSEVMDANVPSALIDDIPAFPNAGSSFPFGINLNNKASCDRL